MIVAVIQARMSSVRFPGKVIHPVAGRPLLQYTIERVGRARAVDRLVVATSEREDDTPVAALCRELSVPCVRGPLEDVAARFLSVFDKFPATGYARINGDSPMIDPAVIDEIVGAFLRERPDLATNVFPRSFPKGISVEVLEPGAYRRAYGRFEEPADYEHVTRFLYRHADDFRIVNVSSGEPASDADLTIDVPGQAQSFADLVRRMDRPHWSYGWRELLAMRAGDRAATGA